MEKRTFSPVAAILGVVALAGVCWGLDQHRKLDQTTFGQRRLELLQSENDRLRGILAEQEKAKSRASNTEQRRKIERSVAAIRQLDFPQPVAYEVLTRAGIRQTVEQKIADQYSDAELKNVATALAALGLIDRDYPLKQKYIELLGEQIAAFYDQHQHKLFMFEDASLDSGQNRIVLAHELTHALQDQNFGLSKMPLELKDNDDMALAASALVEGDATMVMSEYMLQNLSLSGLRDNLAGLMSQNMEQLQKAPRFLRETLIFPYLGGQQFCAALGGYDAVSAAFKEPPKSTAQILHPEKYLATPREDPMRSRVRRYDGERREAACRQRRWRIGNADFDRRLAGRRDGAGGGGRLARRPLSGLQRRQRARLEIGLGQRGRRERIRRRDAAVPGEALPGITAVPVVASDGK